MIRLALALIRFALVLLLVVGRIVRAAGIEVAYYALWPALWAHGRHSEHFRAVTVANVAAIATALVLLVWLAL